MMNTQSKTATARSARKFVWPLAVTLVAGATLASWAVRAAEEEKILSGEYQVSSATELSIESGVGTIEFVRGDTDVITVRIVASRDEDSSWKDGDLSKVELIAKQSGDELTLSVDEQDNIELNWTVTMPRVSTTVIELGVGQLSGELWTQDLDVELGVGEFDMTLFGNNYAFINAEVGIGETRIRGTDKITNERMFIASESYAEGEGDARIKVEVGIGEIDIEVDAR